MTDQGFKPVNCFMKVYVEAGLVPVHGKDEAECLGCFGIVSSDLFVHADKALGTELADSQVLGLQCHHFLSQFL